jgi:hypothetical protein
MAGEQQRLGGWQHQGQSAPRWPADLVPSRRSLRGRAGGSQPLGADGHRHRRACSRAAAKFLASDRNGAAPLEHGYLFISWLRNRSGVHVPAGDEHDRTPTRSQVRREVAARPTTRLPHRQLRSPFLSEGAIPLAHGRSLPRSERPAPTPAHPARPLQANPAAQTGTPNLQKAAISRCTECSTLGWARVQE